MSLKNLKLSGSNILNLYNNQLVGKLKLDNAKTETPALEYKGGNESNITIIINDKLHKTIADNELELLQKIIAACGLTMNSVALINIAHQKAPINEIKEQLKPNTLIMFGVNSDEINLPLVFIEYKLQEYDGVKFVRAHAFPTLSATPVYRKSLWDCLKVIFNK